MPEWVCKMALNAKTKEKIMMMAPNVKQNSGSERQN